MILIHTTLKDTCKEACEKQTEVHDNFIENMQPGKGIPTLLSHDLRYKTLRQLSQPQKFHGHTVEPLEKKQKGQKWNYDLLGILEMNKIIADVWAAAKESNVHENLCDNNVSNLCDETVLDSEMLAALDFT